MNPPSPFRSVATVELSGVLDLTMTGMKPGPLPLRA